MVLVVVLVVVVHTFGTEPALPSHYDLTGPEVSTRHQGHNRAVMEESPTAQLVG